MVTGDISLNGILGRFLTPKTSVTLSRCDVGVTKYGSTRTKPESVGSSINMHDHYAILTSILGVERTETWTPRHRIKTGIGTSRRTEQDR